MKKFLKEKLKNKFIIIIISIIIIILGFQYFSKPKIDINTYVVWVKGEVKVNQNTLKKGKKILLKTGDIITTKNNSASVIEWGDGSLTRLGENGKIEIQELYIKDDLSQINLEFKLINGKTWSNVVSFLGGKSYFKQNFEDIEAAVRGTIFDVNLEKDYIYVTNHEVSVKNKKEGIIEIIPQNKAFSISNFSFIDIEKFLKNIVDKDWLNKNTELDTKFLNTLKVKISKNLNNVDEILKKNKNYNDLLKEYQKFNFIKVDSPDLFEIKNKIKKQLIILAPEEEKRNLIKYSIYDLKDSLELKHINNKTKKSINDLREIIGDSNFDLQNILGDNYNKLESILGGIDLKGLKNKANSIRDNALNKVGNLLK